MSGLAFLFLGLWRCWLGGGIGKNWPMEHGLTVFQLLAVSALMLLGSFSDSFAVAVTNIIGVLVLARGYGHGPMMQYPLNPPSKNDFIYDVVKKLPDDEHAQWWLYASIRYGLPSAVWAIVLWFLGASYWAAPVLGAAIICGCYAGLYQVAQKLPVMTTPGDQHMNWSELIGWTALGALLFAF